MNVLVLGATGTLGRAVTKKLLASTDHHLTLDAHHASPARQRISKLREKYDLHMVADRCASVEEPESERKLIGKQVARFPKSAPLAA